MCQHEKLLKVSQTPIDCDGEYYCLKCGEIFVVFIAKTLTRKEKLISGITIWERDPGRN
jgi:hypothetical protein